MTRGEKVKQIREALGWSQHRMAVELDPDHRLSGGVISHWECGVRPVSNAWWQVLRLRWPEHFEVEESAGSR